MTWHKITDVCTECFSITLKLSTIATFKSFVEQRYDSSNVSDPLLYQISFV
jgi:hypothetical protein